MTNGGNIVNFDFYEFFVCHPPTVNPKEVTLLSQSGSHHFSTFTTKFDHNLLVKVCQNLSNVCRNLLTFVECCLYLIFSLKSNFNFFLNFVEKCQIVLKNVEKYRILLRNDKGCRKMSNFDEKC